MLVNHLDSKCSWFRKWFRGTSKDDTQPKAMRTGVPGLEARVGGYTGSPKVGSLFSLLSSPALSMCIPVYQYTQHRPFLDTSLKMARLFINRLASSPSTIDGVPAWDFDAPPPTSADTSAASLTAAGFLHLADGLEKANDISEAALWIDRSLKVSWFLRIHIHKHEIQVFMFFTAPFGYHSQIFCPPQLGLAVNPHKRYLIFCQGREEPGSDLRCAI